MASGATVGGVETWLSEIVPAFAGAGYEPIVVLTRGMQTNDPKRYRELHPDLPCIEVDGTGLPRPSRILACLRTINRVRPAVVLPLGVIDAVAACTLAKRSNNLLRVIGRTQGLLPPMLADLEDFQSVFDLVVCDGKLNARYLRQIIGFPPERIRHVPNGAKLPTGPHRERETGSPIRIVYVGRLTRGDKRAMDLVGLVHALEASEQPYWLTIVGDGPGKAALEMEFEQNERIVFRGGLSHADVYRDIYPKSDVLVSFSSSESFGISIVEAMMNRVVPVSSRFLGWKSVGTVEDGRNALLFDIGDTKEAARLIAELAASPERLRELADNGAAKAQKDFSWDRCISSWIAILREVQQVSPRSVDLGGERLLQSDSGRLERLGMHPKFVDFIRRQRARIAPVVQPGGEEWPLFNRHHSRDRLEAIASMCSLLDVQDGDLELRTNWSQRA